MLLSSQVQRCQIVQNLELRIRIHRAHKDSGQGEAERTNSTVGDAIIYMAIL